jgi:para-aminobenzoate synthetase / 4-amino-4-deoxychorismate lyase
LFRSVSVRAFVDFPDSLPDSPGRRPSARWQRQFADPLVVLTAWRPDEVVGVLAQVQAHARAGCWCVGELAYEAARAFDPALVTHDAHPDWPLARFAVFAQALPWSPESAPSLAPSAQGVQPDILPPWVMTADYPGYADRVAQARQAMAAGECYQINLTETMAMQLPGGQAAAVDDWFARLQRAQPDGYLVRLDWGDQQVLSLSPELFFDWQPQGEQGLLSCKPMKGTASRHPDPVLDAQARAQLHGSAKERAENVMIVDLLRNDLGRVAVPGSVQVTQLFEVQALPTVWQMTSTITAQTNAGVGLPEVFAALFPCGSVTGAPKARAMHWIRSLESGPRGVYCGALGVVRPGGAATFNVPIRTVTLAREPHSMAPWQARYGVGSAITFYAEPRAEWEELAAKTRFLARGTQAFELLETLLLRDGQYTLLQAHLDRMAASAANFGFEWQRSAAQTCLAELAREHPQGDYRVRLTASCAGQFSVQAVAQPTTPEPVVFNVSDWPLERLGPNYEFVVHKTTRRQHYDERLKPGPGVFDTLLVNERGEITEFTRGNVALKLGGVWLTPPLDCGLLAGTYRAALLAQGTLTESVLFLADLSAAQEIAFFNSVRGWLRAQLQAPAPLS